MLFVNDSKATNADAAAPALSSFARIYWIAGGLPKEGGIEPLRSFFPRIAKAYLIGEAAPAFSRDARRGGALRDLGHARRRGRARGGAMPPRTQRGEPVVLLSPACASFDQFRNFEVRGDAFRARRARDRRYAADRRDTLMMQPRGPKPRRHLVVDHRPLVSGRLPRR